MYSPTTVRSTRISFGDTLSEPDLRSRIERLNTKSASRPALAFEAVAHGDADGVASNRYLELSATACGFAIRHVDYLSTIRTTAFVRARSFLYRKAARFFPTVENGKSKKNRLRVCRVVDVPLHEVSGICLRRRTGRMSLIPVGDRASKIAWFSLS